MKNKWKNEWKKSESRTKTAANERIMKKNELKRREEKKNEIFSFSSDKTQTNGKW